MTATAATSTLTGTTYTPTTSSGTGLNTTTAGEAQDRFLKLLVAQMSNQDPMNPMDNAQMTTQIAQINTVTGIQQLNETMSGMATQISTLQLAQATGMVGRNVLTEGNTLVVQDGKAVGAIELADAAASVKVDVLNGSGQVIDTVSMGSLAGGQHGFSLDASGYPESGALSFRVVATNGGTSVAATALQYDQVVAVGSGADGVKLTLASGGTAAYSDLKAVL